MQHIPSIGFTLDSILAGNPQLSPQTVTALFPEDASPSISARLFRRTTNHLVGPQKALLQHWLQEQRKLMLDQALQFEQKGEPLIRAGLHYRLALNEPLLPLLRNALPLLSSPTFALPIPNPAPYLKHTAQVVDDLCWAANKHAQGVCQLS